jgi:hypothetical protein
MAWMVPLSVLLIVTAVSLLAPAPPLAVTRDAPAFQTLREADGSLFATNHMDKGPLLYAWLHSLPAAIWCVCMPLQHIKSIRNSNMNVHRWSGRLAVACTLLISLTGFMFSFNGMCMSADLWFVHKVRLGSDPKTAITVLAWPSTHLWIRLFAPTLALPAYMTYHYAYKRDIVKHQRWAEICTFVGYVVPLERLVFFTIVGLAYILPFLPKSTRAFWQIPESFWDKHQAEKAAFSFTVWSASAMMAVYVLVKASGRTRTIERKRM